MGSIPQRCADVDAAFLNAVLPDSLRGGVPIAAADVEVIGEGVGFVGEVARVTLRYDGHDSPPPGAIGSLIAKVPTTNPGFKELYRYKYVVTGSLIEGAGNGFVHCRMLNPSWLTN